MLEIFVKISGTIISFKSQSIKFIRAEGFLSLLRERVVLHVIQMVSLGRCSGFNVIIIACTFVCIEVSVIGAEIMGVVLVEANSTSITKRDMMKAFCCGVNGTSGMV